MAKLYHNSIIVATRVVSGWIGRVERVERVEEIGEWGVGLSHAEVQRGRERRGYWGVVTSHEE